MQPTRLSGDTSFEAEKILIERWREMTSTEKARAVVSASSAVRTMAVAGIRDRHPNASEREVMLRFAALSYGEDLVRRAYPDAAAILDD